MPWPRIITAYGDVRAATIAACYLEESASMQLRMLAAAGGDAARMRELLDKLVRDWVREAGTDAEAPAVTLATRTALPARRRVFATGMTPWLRE